MAQNLAIFLKTYKAQISLIYLSQGNLKICILYVYYATKINKQCYLNIVYTQVIMILF